MEMPPRKQAVIAIVLMVAAAAILALTGNTPLRTIDDLHLSLPAQVEAFRGLDVLFCQNEQCMRSFLADDLEDTNACPECESALGDVSLAEGRILPADTVLLKKHYVRPTGQAMSVSVVLSGQEQKSIHRPQQCLPAQGHVIEADRVLEIPVPGREHPLPVRVLSLRRTARALDGREVRQLSAYAYWFVSSNRETPNHLERLFWMSIDRVFRRTAHRWAYVAVSTDRLGETDDPSARLSEFIAALYPHLRAADTAADNDH